VNITTPTLPTIHLNGTGADSLEREYRAVRRAIAAAADALQAATCNQRDFYPQNRVNWDRAQVERLEAFRLLQQVSDYAEQWEAHAAKHRRCRKAAAVAVVQPQP
jgi:hypothetical protein